ncbi:MAG: hypothetical protein ACM3UU_07515 [Ignavibacteriales bacterium]
MANEKCVEEAKKGKPFEMDGKVIIPAAAAAVLKEQKMLCPAFYGILQRDDCIGCPIGERCYVASGTFKDLDNDVQHHIRKAENNGLMSKTFTIKVGDRVTPY